MLIPWKWVKSIECARLSLNYKILHKTNQGSSDGAPLIVVRYVVVDYPQWK